jgi:hypothetical protein
MSATSRRRSSLGKSKLSSVGEHNPLADGQMAREKKPSILVTVGTKVLSFSYGFTTLLAFLYQAFSMGKKWRVMTKRQKAELEAGKLIAM